MGNMETVTKIRRTDENRVLLQNHDNLPLFASLKFTRPVQASCVFILILLFLAIGFPSSLCPPLSLGPHLWPLSALLEARAASIDTPTTLASPHSHISSRKNRGLSHDGSPLPLSLFLLLCLPRDSFGTHSRHSLSLYSAYITLSASPFSSSQHLPLINPICQPVYLSVSG